MKNEILSSIQAIAVDYYGTLVDIGQPFEEIKKWFATTYMDFTSNINGIYMAFLKEHARLQFGSEFYLGKDQLMKSYKKSCDKYNISFIPEEFLRFIINLFTQPPAFSGAQQIIERIRMVYPVILLTNADNDILYESIKLQGFKFDFILTSEDMRYYKPNDKIFSKGCEMLNTPAKNVLMIGDSLSEDVYGAMSNGMQSIWINAKKSSEANDVLQVISISEIESLL